jgi:transcriptional regulator with XRE-family HTH domain
MAKKERGLFPALLKYWRGQKGMSQLDLALAADVSSRHVSFLETGRSRPSREMVLQLGACLSVPLRDQNSLLQAAGFEESFPRPELHGGLSEPINHAIESMLKQQEPYPMVMMDRHYNVMRTNNGADRLLARFIAEPAALTQPINIYRLLFDPRLGRQFVVDWEKLAHLLLSRLHREALQSPQDTEMANLVGQMLEYPDVPESWRQPDFSVPNEAAFTLRVRRDDLELSFLTTLTVFQAPQNITLDEVKIESYFPMDEATVTACRRLAAG